MRLLLDTNVLLWALADDPRLPAKARALIVDSANSISVSAVTIWEIAIKHGLGRGDMPLSASEARTYCRESGYSFLEVSAAHAAEVEKLPALHADPFDRLLVAQALHEPMQLLTHDAMVSQYSPANVLV